MKVTAVLVAYKRMLELEKIVADLNKYPFIDEVLIWDNTKDNIGVYGRYLMMAKAKNDVIYTQDDDCLIEGIDKLYSRFDGTRLVNGMKAERIKDYSGKESLVGWGAFLKKEWTKVVNEYVERYGADEVLYQTADRVFTTLLTVPRLTLPVVVRDFPSAMHSHAMSLQEDYARNINIGRARTSGLLRARGEPVPV